MSATSQDDDLRARLGAIWTKYLAKQKEVADGYQSLLSVIGDYSDDAPRIDDVLEEMARDEDQCAELLDQLADVFAEPDDGRE